MQKCLRVAMVATPVSVLWPQDFETEHLSPIQQVHSSERSVQRPWPQHHMQDTWVPWPRHFETERLRAVAPNATASSKVSRSRPCPKVLPKVASSGGEIILEKAISTIVLALFPFFIL